MMLLLKNRVLSLRNEYKAKVGDIFSTLFNRVVVTELTEIKHWDKKRLYSYINKMFDVYGIIGVDSKLMGEPALMAKLVKNNIKSDIERLTMELKEKEVRDQLKNTLNKLKSVIVRLMKECINDDRLRKLNEKQLHEKLAKVFDQRIY